MSLTYHHRLILINAAHTAYFTYSTYCIFLVLFLLFFSVNFLFTCLISYISMLVLTLKVCIGAGAATKKPFPIALIKEF